MSIVQIKTDPTPRDLLVFAALWVVFFAILARIALHPGPAIGIAGIVTTGALAASLLLNRDFSRRSQMPGILFPLLLGAVWGAGPLADALGLDAAVARRVAMALSLGIGALGALICLVSRSAGARLYKAWMLAAMPIGWGISHVLMLGVFFLVVTPLGLVLRAARYDPMQRRADPDAATYWSARKPAPEARRYLRQS